MVITFAAVAAAAIAGTAAAATAAGQSVQPGPPAVFSWGWNGAGEVGDGTTTPQATPVPVLGLPSVHGLQVTMRQIVSGYLSQACAVLLADGTVYTWGRNHFGELGDGTTTDRFTPVLVPNLSGITQIAQGDWHMLAVGAGGVVWAWGFNDDGQLGDGTTTNRTSPVQVPVLTGITQVAAGSDHSLALRFDGTVLSWGANDYGQLGTGTTVSRSAPGPAPGVSGIIQVAAGDHVSYALRSDGTLLAWGAGFLGNGPRRAGYRSRHRAAGWGDPGLDQRRRHPGDRRSQPHRVRLGLQWGRRDRERDVERRAAHPGATEPERGHPGQRGWLRERGDPLRWVAVYLGLQSPVQPRQRREHG
jgi:hypothetical protein